MPLLLRKPRENRPPIRRSRASRAKHPQNPAGAGGILEFGRFQVSLRRRELLSEAVPIELGTRAFDLLLVLIEADGALVTKEELMSRVWRGIIVAEDNLKVQISALRKALGEDRNLIRTEFGWGYRFTAAVRSTAESTACRPSIRLQHRPRRRLLALGSSPQSFRRW